MVERWLVWVVAGILLILLEIFAPSFFLLFLGIAAILTGVVSGVLDLSVAAELIIFSILAVLNTFLWALFVRPRLKYAAGTSQDEYVGTPGVAVTDIDSQGGQVMLDTPAIGSRLWEAFADQPISRGTRVLLVRITGNRLYVTPYSPEEAERLQAQSETDQHLLPLQRKFSDLLKDFLDEVFSK